MTAAADWSDVPYMAASTGPEPADDRGPNVSILRIRNIWLMCLTFMTILHLVGEPDPQDVCLAEEHGNTTITMFYPAKTNKSAHFLEVLIYCGNPMREMYHYKNEMLLYEDELFRGRVWCEPELAKTGRIECLLTNLKLSDTGICHLVAWVNEEVYYKLCHLSVISKSPPQEEL